MVCVLQQFLVITTIDVLTFEPLREITTRSQNRLWSMKCWLIFRKILCSVPLLFFVFVVTIRQNVFWSQMGLVDVLSLNFLSTSFRKFCEDISAGLSYCPLIRVLVVNFAFCSHFQPLQCRHDCRQFEDSNRHRNMSLGFAGNAWRVSKQGSKTPSDRTNRTYIYTDRAVCDKRSSSLS
jgi:hypothetical protein